MADPLGLSGAPLAIVTATLQSGQLLYRTVKSFKNHQRVIRQLQDELDSLIGVLRSLKDVVERDDSTLEPLKVPLVRCREACDDFNDLMVKCTAHSGGSRTSFRDWARLRYMDSDVTGFTNMLSGYKSTIAVALGDANLRSSTVTLQVLNQYKEMIDSTTHDLEDHLTDINNKLQSLVVKPAVSSPDNAIDLRRIREEKDSTEQCLKICRDVADHINHLGLLPIRNSASFPSQQQLTSVSAESLSRADIMTISTLSECNDKLAETILHLQTSIRDLNDRLDQVSASTSHDVSINSDKSIRSLYAELQSVKQCLAICKDASQRASPERVHVLEDITTADDGQQVFVSTLGDLMKVKGASAGSRSIQFIGSCSDDSLQQYFRLHAHR